MTEQEKRELVKLLRKYQMDLLDIEEENRCMGRHDRNPDVKAQFNHARCIVNRLSYDVEQDIIR